MKTFLRWLITAIAVGLAAWLVPGIEIEGTTAWFAVAVIAVILAFLNTFIKPVLQALSCGFMILTLGLFALVINAGLLYFSAWVCNSILGIGFFVNGFWPAFWGGIIISIVTVILGAIFGVNNNKTAY